MKSKRWTGEKTVNKWDELWTVEAAINELWRDMFDAMKRENMVVEADTIRLSLTKKENRDGIEVCVNGKKYDPLNQLFKTVIKITCTMRDATSRSYDPEVIYKNGRSTAVKWEDGTVTTVKLAEGEPECDYNAFTAALAIKAIGNNSRIRKILQKKTVVQKKKEKKEERKKEDA